MNGVQDSECVLVRPPLGVLDGLLRPAEQEELHPGTGEVWFPHMAYETAVLPSCIRISTRGGIYGQIYPFT